MLRLRLMIVSRKIFKEKKKNMLLKFEEIVFN